MKNATIRSKKWMLCAMVGLGLGLAASVAQALPRQCRIQECWEFMGIDICYYDSGWYDC